MPLVLSEPPQIVPMTRSAISTGTRGTLAISSRASRTQARPASIVARVPPACWTTSVCTGRPVDATVRARSALSKPSQPSETISTAPTFGCVASRRSIIAE